MNINFLLGFAGTLVGIGIFHYLFRQLTVAVEDESVALITLFGKHSRTLKEPGLHFTPEKILPTGKIYEVSLQRDFRLYEDLHINDVNGTTLVIDLWVEFKISRPETAFFGVENWEELLATGITQATMSVLSGLEFKEILAGSSQLSDRILSEVKGSSHRWGLSIESAHIRDVGLLPEVSKQLFDSVAARLERVKALVEERGRLAIAELDAKTATEVADLKARARALYPQKLSPVFARMNQNPRVAEAYRRLHRLSRTQPSKTIYFDGFAQGELSPVEAAMLWPQLEGQPSATRSS